MDVKLVSRIIGPIVVVEFNVNRVKACVAARINRHTYVGSSTVPYRQVVDIIAYIIQITPSTPTG